MTSTGYESTCRIDCTMPCRLTAMVPWDDAAQGASARLKRALSASTGLCFNGVSVALLNSWPSCIPIPIGDDNDLPSIFLRLGNFDAPDQRPLQIHTPMTILFWDGFVSDDIQLGTWIAVRL